MYIINYRLGILDFGKSASISSYIIYPSLSTHHNFKFIKFNLHIGFESESIALCPMIIRQFSSCGIALSPRNFDFQIFKQTKLVRRNKNSVLWIGLKMTQCLHKSFQKWNPMQKDKFLLFKYFGISFVTHVLRRFWILMKICEFFIHMITSE